ncbi:MAG: ATP-binding cassette domain-containing protein, partial [Thermoleophilia bacterium]|nr:ATP-binding cassette domain-containing protein [Thermoleophilia bacterium]
LERVWLGHRLVNRPNQLSGGEQQRVAVALALVHDPAFVLADEPTGNLDQTSGAQVLDLMRAAVDDYGQTIVMVTHDATSAAIADRVLFLFDGKIVDRIEQPDADQVFERIRQLSVHADGEA